MKKGAKLLISLGVLLVLLLFLAWMVVERAPVRVNAVLLQQRASAAGADALVVFDLVNNGDIPIVCPDSWYLEFEDGSTTNLAVAPSGDLTVSPGSTGTISISNPLTVKPWRLGACYYEEDVVFGVKVQIDQSPLKKYLPPDASRVQGKVALSGWVNRPESSSSLSKPVE